MPRTRVCCFRKSSNVNVLLMFEKQQHYQLLRAKHLHTEFENQYADTYYLILCAVSAEKKTQCIVIVIECFCADSNGLANVVYLDKRNQHRFV